MEPHVEQAVLDMAIEQPAYGQVRVANELTRRGTFISPTGVRSVWLRNDLHTFQRRLKALAAKLSQETGWCRANRSASDGESQKKRKLKLYDRRNALSAADMLNDRVLPFYEQQEVPLLRILTDRGTLRTRSS